MKKKLSRGATPQMQYDAVYKVLPFVKSFIKKHKGLVSPSQPQIGAQFGKTHTWAWMCVEYLVQEGYVSRDPNRKYKNIIIKK